LLVRSGVSDLRLRATRTALDRLRSNGGGGLDRNDCRPAETPPSTWAGHCVVVAQVNKLQPTDLDDKNHRHYQQQQQKEVAALTHNGFLGAWEGLRCAVRLVLLVVMTPARDLLDRANFLFGAAIVTSPCPRVIIERHALS
jgi:hypothetical protein